MRSAVVFRVFNATISHHGRIEYDGATYHIMVRANSSNRIYDSPNGADEALLAEEWTVRCLTALWPPQISRTERTDYGWFVRPAATAVKPQNSDRLGKSRVEPVPLAHIENPVRRAIASMMAAMDENTGRLQAHLQERGIAENKLVIFSSDNGGSPGGNHTLVDPNCANYSLNTPLRSFKGECWEN